MPANKQVTPNAPVCILALTRKPLEIMNTKDPATQKGISTWEMADQDLFLFSVPPQVHSEHVED